MAEPKPFRFDSHQRSVGAAGGRRRVAWPWIALSLSLHGAIILFALMGAARGGHSELLGTLEVSIVGAPSAGDPDSRSAAGTADAKPAPAAAPRPETPPATPPEAAPVPAPSPAPQPAALTPSLAQQEAPAKPPAGVPPAAATPPRVAAAPPAAPGAPRTAAAEAPKRPERAVPPDPLPPPRRAAEMEAMPSAPATPVDPAIKRPEVAKPSEAPAPREIERTETSPVAPRLEEAKQAPQPPPAPSTMAQASPLPRATAARAAAPPAKPAARTGLKRAPRGQTASLGAPTGGDRLGRSDSDDAAGLLNVNLNPRFRRPPAPPAYPRRSIERDEEGVVLVRALVDPAGAPQRVVIHKGSGFPLLDEAALKAVSGWRFEPMVRDGRAVAAWVQVPVRFRLN